MIYIAIYGSTFWIYFVKLLIVSIFNLVDAWFIADCFSTSSCNNRIQCCWRIKSRSSLLSWFSFLTSIYLIELFTLAIFLGLVSMIQNELLPFKGLFPRTLFSVSLINICSNCSFVNCSLFVGHSLYYYYYYYYLLWFGCCLLLRNLFIASKIKSSNFSIAF